MNVHAFYRPVLEHFRRGRMRLFAKLFAIDGETRVLALGGSSFNWTLLPVRPRLTILNIYEQSGKAPWAAYVVGDGCKTAFPDCSFDIVFSNSVIEHVGGEARQREFAGEVMRCGSAFFVQTPNKWFPVDTHTWMPFAHWLPQRIFRKLVPLSRDSCSSSPTRATAKTLATCAC